MASPSSNASRVFVVGAGFGGLACAYELASAGYDVHVFEARERVGGRIQSLGDLIAGKNVEAGGELLGANHPHVIAYADKFGFEFLDVSEDTVAPSPMILGGRKLSPAEVKSISAEAETAVSSLTEEAKTILEDEPWNSPDAKRLDLKTAANWISALDISPLAKSLLDVQFTGTNGVPTTRQSYLGNLTLVKGGGLEKYFTETEVYRLKGGNQQYALRFAKELGEDRLSFNCPIVEILSTDKGMEVVDSRGKKYFADDVVIAVPPSVWSRIRFSPDLPATLRPQFGHNVKYLAVVDGPFWRSAKLPPDATTDGGITETWHGTVGQGDAGPQALIAFTGGEPARVNHLRPASEQDSAYQQDFESLYPGFNSHFIEGKFIDWIGDQWTRGGYSFPAPGEITTIGPILRNGIGRLHFAGEHACYKFVGYAEGALNAGASLAKRIAARDGAT
jgi:monoamine oxidase